MRISFHSQNKSIFELTLRKLVSRRKTALRVYSEFQKTIDFRQGIGNGNLYPFFSTKLQLFIISAIEWRIMYLLEASVGMRWPMSWASLGPCLGSRGHARTIGNPRVINRQAIPTKGPMARAR